MRIALILVLLIVLAIAGAALFFRVVPMPAATWHVDPAEATPPASPNYALRQGDAAARIAAPPATVAARINAQADREGARLIAGSLEEGWATFVVRSRLMGYPDAVSIRLRAEGDETVVEIFSRSRFGYSDMGVNAARVARWLDAASG